MSKSAISTRSCLKEMKQYKKDNKKLLKKSLKNKDYESIEICIEFIKKYDGLYKTMKYEKYLKQLKINENILQVLERRHQNRLNVEKLKERIEKLEELNYNIYEHFKEKMTKEVSQHINRYTEKRISEIEKRMRKEKQRAPIKRNKPVLNKRNKINP